ncbi:superoxide dismutase, putative [Babesia caballi]|uniref:Superoxide dismutase [Fe] n=1 Tax=Babesia caballi TaxID=5871 RepID=A0AAV4LR76_BABCB|nr:superoxide dismutase, putative [Babesia caballi]
MVRVVEAVVRPAQVRPVGREGRRGLDPGFVVLHCHDRRTAAAGTHLSRETVGLRTGLLRKREELGPQLVVGGAVGQPLGAEPNGLEVGNHRHPRVALVQLLQDEEHEVLRRPVVGVRLDDAEGAEQVLGDVLLQLEVVTARQVPAGLLVHVLKRRRGLGGDALLVEEAADGVAALPVLRPLLRLGGGVGLRGGSGGLRRIGRPLHAVATHAHGDICGCSAQPDLPHGEGDQTEPTLVVHGDVVHQDAVTLVRSPPAEDAAADGGRHVADVLHDHGLGLLHAALPAVPVLEAVVLPVGQDLGLGQVGLVAVDDALPAVGDGVVGVEDVVGLDALGERQAGRHVLGRLEDHEARERAPDGEHEVDLVLELRAVLDPEVGRAAGVAAQNLVENEGAEGVANHCDLGVAEPARGVVPQPRDLPVELRHDVLQDEVAVARVEVKADVEDVVREHLARLLGRGDISAVEQPATVVHPIATAYTFCASMMCRFQSTRSLIHKSYIHSLRSRYFNLSTSPGRMSFKLPALPYGMRDLLPHISEETLSFHYGKHHAGYVAKLNGLVKGTPLESLSLEDLVTGQSGAVFNNAAQIWNHTFYWHSMGPNCGGEPTGPIRQKIEDKFGSFTAFKQDFSNLLAGHFGSGWGWLVLKDDGSTEIVQTHDAGSPLKEKLGRPLLCCDVWEHAYYIDYKNDRASYINTGEPGGPPVSNEADAGSQRESATPTRRRASKLSNRVLKRIRSIERLYRPRTIPGRDLGRESGFAKGAGAALEQSLAVPLTEEIAEDAVEAPRHAGSNENAHIKGLVKSIYRSATGGVFNDALWKRYVHRLSVVAGVLQPADICLVMYSFAKVRYVAWRRFSAGRSYRDQGLLKILEPLIVRHVNGLSCGGAALILNSMKRLELANYDIIDLATNEICLKMDCANLQDIALTANALAFFHVYHQRFWKMLTKAVSLRHHQMTPLQASLLLAALAKLDIRNPLLLRLLKDKLRPAVERGELSQELLTLAFHSFAKLDFSARNFYDACVDRFGRMLEEDPESVDAQSLVLYLYAAVCVLDVPVQTVEKSLRLLCARADVLKNYKALKLKYTFDFLKSKQPALVASFDGQLKQLHSRVQRYKLRNVRPPARNLRSTCLQMQRRLSRWALEVSRMLQTHNVEHARNVWFDYAHADIYVKEHGVVVKCAGEAPSDCHVNACRALQLLRHVQAADCVRAGGGKRADDEGGTTSAVTTTRFQGLRVCLLPYFEWNALKSNEEKLGYLRKFGESWAAVHFPQQSN